MSADPLQAALAALQTGDNAKAVELLRVIGPALSDDPVALQAWAVALTAPDLNAEAHALSARALRLAPADANAHFNVGVHLSGRGDLAGAIARYEQALALMPNHIGALNNLSDLYRRRGRSEEGWALMQRFFAAGGGANGMALRMAKLAIDTRRFDDAKTWFAAAAAEQPGSPMVAFETAMLTLLLEDFATGWPQYEARIALYGLPGLAMYPYQLPHWDGATRQRVLVHREQGLGDMMMFAAAAPGMIDDGIDLHLAMAPSLQRLFAASFPRAKVWPSVTVAQSAVQPAQRFLEACGPLDSHIPMCSLGAARMTAGPPNPAPYLRPPPAVAAEWRARLDALAPRRAGERRIGLCFAARKPTFSDDGMTNGIRKSLSAADLAPLADVANVRWFSLHDASTAGLYADAQAPVTDLSPWISDFADTAAIIAEMDLVISVDTAVAHLAGGLGAPLWLLLWRNADWRWGAERSDALWYRNVTTFRQTQAGRWGDVVDRVVAALT